MRFSELTNFAVNDVTTTDILPTTDISANIDKKITMQNLFSWIATKAKTTFNGASQTIQAAINACVPNTRTVNGKALSSDITLSASDVSAVPTSRTVNGHALSSNVTVTADDIGITHISALQQSSDVTLENSSNTSIMDTGELNAGKYLIVFGARLDTNSANGCGLGLSTTNNGSMIRQSHVSQRNYGQTWLQGSMLINVNSKTKYYLIAWQNSGASCNVTQGYINLIKLRG